MPQNIELWISMKRFGSVYFFPERKCYFNADCISQTSILLIKHIEKLGSRSPLWAIFWENSWKNDEKINHLKSIQNHFRDVPVPPGHQKTWFYFELSFRKSVKTSKYNDSQNSLRNWADMKVRAPKAMRFRFLNVFFYFKWLVEHISCAL